MSAKYTFLAWDTPIENAPLKLALLQLANNANDDGFSYYSISKMAVACGMSERTFMRKISELEEMDVLTVERRSNRPSLYTLLGDEMGVSLCHLQTPEVTESHPEVTESHLVGDRESPVLNSTPNIYPKSISNRSLNAKELTLLCNEVLEAWNIRFPTLPQVIKITKQRKIAIMSCITEFNEDFGLDKVDGWDGVFEYAGRSKFLMGDNDRGWTMSFDFITNKTKLLKVIEGVHDNGQRTT